MTTHPLQTFRVQFLGSRCEGATNVVDERAVRAADVQDATGAVANDDWPPAARSYRLSDLDGEELAHVFKLDP